ncbi:MAG: cytochrome c oxidase accessory protein CcoG [bacterium]|nr:cytochrome c oxidase accessory protein CcoG [bacterium]
MTGIQEPEDNFRDKLATIDQQGRRLWVYPTKPVGKLYTARTILSWFLLVFLFGAPFVRIDGNPLLQFDILHRKFFIFGFIFWPQDFFLFVLITIAFVVLVILFTAAFGRLFCGWVCPQTIFMEMVFRKIEYLLEGNGPRQRELDHAPMSAGKFLRKSTKHLIFFSLSFLIGNTFLAYIIGTDALRDIVTSSPTEHMTGFIAMVIFSGVFYFVFAWFREQACTLVCPYGRLQSVLLDANSIVIAYDFRRGEKRGPVMRGQDFSQRGHCIDCDACVKVCPTGIDIRNGTQLECINCTACIDACNRVMSRMKLPPGLIKYSSYNRIAEGKPLRFTPRMWIYTGVLTVLLGLIVFFLVSRSEVETTVLRTTGSLYEELEDGSIRNLYTVSVINKTAETLPLTLEMVQPQGTLTIVGPPLDVPPQGKDETVISVQIPRKQIFSSNSTVIIRVMQGNVEIEEVRTTFVGPDPREHHEEKNDDHQENDND